MTIRVDQYELPEVILQMLIDIAILIKEDIRNKTGMDDSGACIAAAGIVKQFAQTTGEGLQDQIMRDKEEESVH